MYAKERNQTIQNLEIAKWGFEMADRRFHHLGENNGMAC